MQLSPEDRRRITTISIFAASVIAALGFGVCAALLVLGETRLALGALAGHGIAMLCGLTWIVGALVTFDGPFNRFAKATIGFSPVRLVVVAGATFAIGWFARDHVDLAALGLAFVATELLLQILQGWCFMKLADATSPYKERAPARFGATIGGLRFGNLTFGLRKKRDA